MTAGEKTVLSQLLNLARGYLGSGFINENSAIFTDDEDTNSAAERQIQDTSESSLPLAYLTEEEDLTADESLENTLVLVLGKLSGQAEENLLDRVLASAGLYRDKNYVLIDDEAENPARLGQKIRALRPKLILWLGKSNARPIPAPDETPVLTTYHPNDLLRNDSLKRPVFEDMKLLMALLAGLDQDYLGEITDLLKKYAASDTDFAARVREYLP